MNSFTFPFDPLPFALLILRIVLGAIFFAHGAQKVMGWFDGYGLKGTAQYFTNVLRIPLPLFYVAAFTEFFGGIALALGILTRFAALGMVVIMSVAILKANWKNGFFMNWGAVGGRGEGYEYDLALLAMALFLTLSGPGQFALLN